MICPKCGYEIDNNAVYCPYCGASVQRAEGQDTSQQEGYSSYGGGTYSTGSYSSSSGGSYSSGSYSSNPGGSYSSYSAGKSSGYQDSSYRRRPQPAVVSIEDLPPDLRPMSAWAYVGWGILFAIPIVGLILIIVFSCASGNINRKRFARSYLCWWLIAIIICAILFLTGALSWNMIRNGWLFGLRF